jgi:pre-mRNA-splicing factor 38A
MNEKPTIVSKESHNMMLIDKIVRTKIFNCRFWKEECFGLTAESLVDKAIQLQYVGGTYGGPRKPSQFICLIAKLLQINPEKEIIYEFIKTKDYKYVNILGLFYLRLIGSPREIYQMLEFFYEDYRKIRVRL